MYCIVNGILITVDKTIDIWRFKDPTLDLRKIPDFYDPFENKEKLHTSDKFKIDEKKIIYITNNESEKLIGDTAVYVIT